MAVTQNNYTGNGSTVLYSFTFPYLDPSDIKIEVNGTLTTAYTLANATTIQFNTAPANGATIRIYRDTDIEQLSATFFPGSSIRADDLNDDFTQTLYKTQELESLVEPLASLQGTYYGAYASNPTVDPFGNPITPGDLYFNTTLDQMYVFNGSTWQQASADATITRFKFTAAGGETSLSGADANSNILTYTVGLEMVYLNGAFLTRGVDYTATNGSSITGLVALTAGDVAEIIVFSQINAIESIPGANIADGTITSAKILDNTIVNADINTNAGIVASKLSFTQAGTGATARTVASKLSDVVSVKDFGAVGDGVTDDTAAFTAAGSSASSVQVIIPRGTWLLNSNPTPTGVTTWLIEAGAVITGVGILPGNKVQFGNSVYNNESVARPANARGFASLQGPTSGSITANEYDAIDYNLFKVVGDALDCESGAGPATKVNGLSSIHAFGGAGATGGRHAMYGLAILNATTSPTSTDRNYVGVQGQAIASVSDNGVFGLTKGALFGGSFIAELYSGANNFNNVTACEFNTGIAAGTQPDYRSGIQIASRDADRGVNVDAMVSLSDISSTSNGKWLNAILIGPQNGQHPLDPTNGTIIKTSGSATIKDVIDVSSYTVTGSLLKGTNFFASNTGLTINASNSSVELGNKIASNTPFIDFNSSGNNNDYDVRLIANGGTGVTGNGSLVIQAGAVLLPNDVRLSAINDFVDDAAAAAGGYAVGRLYRTGSTLKIRVV